MDNKYQVELDEFNNNFSYFKKSRIVLYGVGRYTGTLISGLKNEYQFVGLMDKNPENIGKEFFGVPVMLKEDVEKEADVVIINTSEIYWELIYKRIADIKIPVYFRNGKEAQLSSQGNKHNPYKELFLQELEERVQRASIISFDFYDTLFMRMVCNPRDVFYLVEEEIKESWNAEKCFTEIRNNAIEKAPVHYSYDELYELIKQEADISSEVAEDVKQIEWELEKRVLVPRTNIFDLLKKCVQEKKEVYIISDMYLPRKFYQEIFEEYGIEFPSEHILVSSEEKKSKDDGSLWRYYANNILSGRDALHIGDNEKSDIQKAKEYGIDTYLTPNSWNMLQVSSLGEITPDICTTYASIVIGLIQKRLFEKPYALYNIEGKMVIQTLKDMGYIVFGPVILTYLLWLRREQKKDNLEHLIFFARDGYFLEEDYKYLCSLLETEPDCSYLGISRQLAITASIRNRQDLLEYMRVPYGGTVEKLFEKRLGIKIEYDETKDMEDYIELYHEQIMANLKRIRQNYEAYLKNMELSEKCAIVDLAYYGNCQKYLNKLLIAMNGIERPLAGYYFVASLNEDNPNRKYQNMKACFQKDSDLRAKQSYIRNRIFDLESFLTAPYGMIKEVDENFQFICAPTGKNQIYFSEKEEINEGVKAFIRDYIVLIGNKELEIDAIFVDKYYGVCVSNGFEFSKNIKETFYNDNAMMHDNDSNLFE